MSNISGKKALITGGGRGLGRATAIAFAKEGIHVAITGRNEQKLQETVNELTALGVDAIYEVFDIANPDEVKTGIANIISKFGTIDILVNNAGIAAFGSFLEMEPEKWVNMINTNVLGMYYVTKEILPLMVNQNEGDIFNVSSTAGLTGNSGTSAY